MFIHYVLFCSYTEFISDLKPMWLGGIECTDPVMNGRSSSSEVVEVYHIITFTEP